MMSILDDNKVSNWFFLKNLYFYWWKILLFYKIILFYKKNIKNSNNVKRENFKFNRVLLSTAVSWLFLCWHPKIIPNVLKLQKVYVFYLI